MEVSKVLQGVFKGFSRTIKGFSERPLRYESRGLQGYLKEFQRVFKECFNKVMRKS